jgi:hypothetical protein
MGQKAGRGQLQRSHQNASCGNLLHEGYQSCAVKLAGGFESVIHGGGLETSLTWGLHVVDENPGSDTSTGIFMEKPPVSLF